jgi:hypothetical protein
MSAPKIPGATAGLVFGVRSTQGDGHAAVALKSGRAVLFRITGRNGPTLRKKIEPFVVEDGKRLLDD